MNENWLTQLAPAHAPAAVGWWPPAPGWWVVAALCVLATVVVVLKLRDPGRALRRAALRQLKIIRASDADGAAVARATQNLLRRYALEAFGHSQVSRLTGEAWLQFVMERGGDALAGAPGRSMLAAAFGNTSADDRDRWFAAAEGFIKRAGKRRQGPGAEPARGARALSSSVVRALSGFIRRAPGGSAARAPDGLAAQAPDGATTRAPDDSAARAPAGSAAHAPDGSAAQVPDGSAARPPEGSAARATDRSAARAPGAGGTQAQGANGTLRAGGGA
jgi:hypothetical protein